MFWGIPPKIACSSSLSKGGRPTKTGVAASLVTSRVARARLGRNRPVPDTGRLTGDLFWPVPITAARVKERRRVPGQAHEGQGPQ